ncbi:sialate O-acetylesterase [Dyadobacter sp.]|uniref:sialate O-acetylesterase n=1 Tax=Dyadobacter sp. TaxID=1914288 RepID=UPI003F72DC45
MKNLFISLLFFTCFFNANAQMSISLPLERSVFQRNANGQASVAIAGQVRPGSPIGTNFVIKYRTTSLDKNGNPLAAATIWNSGLASTPYAGVFKFSATFNTGWYLLEVGAFEGNNNFPTTSGAVKFGVGEVVFIAGQSNAQGTDNITNSAVNPTFYDCVNSISNNQICKNTYQFPYIEKIVDGKLITPSGNRSAWFYGHLGKRIADELIPGTVVPTLFFNAAFTGSSVENWAKTAESDVEIAPLPLLNGQPCCAFVTPEKGWFNDWDTQGPEGQPYKTLKNSLTYFGSMFGARCVLWHQGESDNVLNTSELSYDSKLQIVLNKSREHFSNNLSWAISRATWYMGTVDPAVIAGQQKTRTYTGNLQQGPSAAAVWNSDNIPASKRRADDNTHFIAPGLVDAGNQAFEAFKTGFGFTPIKNMTSVSATTPPNLTITKSGANVTIKAPAGYTYKWVEGDNHITTAFSSAQSITVSNSNWKSYRCYIISPTRTMVSQAVYTPMLAVGGAARMGAEEEAIIEKEEFVPVQITPNPAKEKTVVRYTLREPSLVRIDLVDLNGHILFTSGEHAYAAGNQEQTLDLSKLFVGSYVCRIKIGSYFVSRHFVLER